MPPGDSGTEHAPHALAARVRAALRAMALRSAGVWWASRVRAAFRAIALRSLAGRWRACCLAWRARASGDAAPWPSRFSALVIARDRRGLVLCGWSAWRLA